jgi:hypothetical protein
MNVFRSLAKVVIPFETRQAIRAFKILQARGTSVYRS